ncbi:monovalent cation/H+ antiporter complex subunit F [Streptomyces sp. G45]|uniref:monovalent cation/H+ antiporter complex subunit F n=1 Tax=Streptomyces sp. G45 TaxID=3406627 RepID=UPI003C218126
MNAWLGCGAALLALGVPPVLWGAASGPLPRRILAQNAGGTVVALAVLLLAQGYGRPSYIDLSLVLALLGPVGTLVCVRLLAEDLAPGPPRAATAVTAGCVTGSVVVTAAVCAATAPGRATVKLATTGALVALGNVIAARALSARLVEAEDESGGRVGPGDGPGQRACPCPGGQRTGTATDGEAAMDGHRRPRTAMDGHGRGDAMSDDLGGSG